MINKYLKKLGFDFSWKNSSPTTEQQVHEALSILQEESAEIVQAVSKIFRFGIDSVWKTESNRDHLEEELGDLICMINLLIKLEVIKQENLDFYASKKLDKLKKWSNLDI